MFNVLITLTRQLQQIKQCDETPSCGERTLNIKQKKNDSQKTWPLKLWLHWVPYWFWGCQERSGDQELSISGHWEVNYSSTVWEMCLNLGNTAKKGSKRIPRCLNRSLVKAWDQSSCFVVKSINRTGNAQASPQFVLILLVSRSDENRDLTFHKVCEIEQREVRTFTALS